MDLYLARFGPNKDRNSKARVVPANRAHFSSGPSVPPPQPVVPYPFYRDARGRAFLPPDLFSKDSATPFPKLEEEEPDVNPNLQPILQAAVKKSIIRIKLKQIESRFEQLGADTGVTRAELQLLRETKFDRAVLEDFLRGKWSDEHGAKGSLRGIKPVLSSWTNPDGSRGIVRGYATFVQLLQWKFKAERDVRRMNLNEFMKDPDTDIDWEYVSTLLYNEGEYDMTAFRCEHMYKNFLGPHVLQLPSWNQDDIDKLESIIRQSAYLNFVEIAEKMGKGYSPLICFKVFTDHLKHLRKPYHTLPPSTSAASASTIVNEEMEDSESESDQSSDDEDDANIVIQTGDSTACLESLKLNIFNQGERESIAHELAIELLEEDPVEKKGAFIDVEDTILLVTIDQLNGGHQDIRNFRCRDEVMDYLIPDVEEILEWRHHLCIEARIDSLFRGFYVPWTKREDRRLLHLAWKYKHNWSRISQRFKKPFRSCRSLCTRLRTLKNNLKYYYSLEEYHKYVYMNGDDEVNETRGPYPLLRRALACMESVLRAYKFGQDWVAKYTQIYYSKKSGYYQIKKNLKLFHTELLRIHNEDRVKMKRILTVPEKKVLKLTDPLSPDEPSVLRMEVDKPSKAAAVVTTAKLRAGSYNPHCERRLEDLDVFPDRPPNNLELIKYLWNIPMKDIERARAFLLKFLDAQQVDIQPSNQAERDVRAIKFRRCGFNRQKARCLATAAHLRRIEFRSAAEINEEKATLLTPFESSTLGWFRWFSTRNNIKRGVKRKIPEKTELLQFPELKNLLHKKYFQSARIKSESNEGLDPDVKIKIEDEQLEHEHSNTNSYILEPESLIVNSHNVVQVVPEDHLWINVAAQEIVQEEVEPLSSPLEYSTESMIATQIAENVLDAYTPASLPDASIPVKPSHTLKTVTSGKGKKVSRMRQVRREAALVRWASAKNKVKLDESESFNTSNLVPEQ